MPFLFAANAFFASALFCAIASRKLTAGLGTGGSFSGDALLGAGLDGVDFVRTLGDAVDVDAAAVGVLERPVGVLGTPSLVGGLGTREFDDGGMRDIAIEVKDSDIPYKRNRCPRDQTQSPQVKVVLIKSIFNSH